MLEFFKNKRIAKKKEVVYVEPKPLSIFDYITDICANKKGDIHLTRDPNLSKFDPFMVLRYLSLDEGYLPLTSVVNQYHSHLTKEELYKSLIIIIPKGRRFLKYPKRVKAIQKEEDIKVLSEYFGCSRSESREYLSLGLVRDRDVSIIKERFGGREK